MRRGRELVLAGAPGVSVLLLCHLIFGINRDETLPRHLGAPRTIVEVSWDGYPHALNEKTVAGVPFAPSKIKFGTPHVRDSVGTMSGRVLELDPGQTEIIPKGIFHYEQVEFAVEKKANAYRISCDLILAPRDREYRRDAFHVFLDGGGMIKLIFAPDGMARINLPSLETDLWEYPINEVMHLTILLNLKERVIMGIINEQKFEFPLTAAEPGLRGLRFNFSDPTDRFGHAAIDNVKIIAFGEWNDSP
jgi:hypothetical protein